MQVVKDTEPTPACASLSFEPFCFAYAMNSFRSFAGKSLRATITIGVPDARPMGSKSFTGSYLRFG